MSLKTAGSTSTTQLSSIADTTIMTDQTFLMRYADNESPRFDGSVYAIKWSTVVKHKGVDVQGVTTTDLHEGDDIVYQYTYKHGRTRLWKGVVVRTESDTVQLVLSESSANSDADCVSDASTGSNNEAKRTSAQSETILKGKRKSRKRTQKKAENLPPKKKAKGGSILNIGIGEIGEKGGGQITTTSGGCHPQLSTILISALHQTSRKSLVSAGGGCPPTTSMYTVTRGSPLIAGATSYSLPPLNTYSPARTPMYLDQVSIHEGVMLRDELR